MERLTKGCNTLPCLVLKLCALEQHTLHAEPIAPQVAVQSLPGQGRGLVARQRLSKGELLCQVPMSLVLTQEGVLKGTWTHHQQQRGAPRGAARRRAVGGVASVPAQRRWQFDRCGTACRH